VLHLFCSLFDAFVGLLSDGESQIGGWAKFVACYGKKSAEDKLFKNF
jgi:hypothetical protein